MGGGGLNHLRISYHLAVVTVVLSLVYSVCSLFDVRHRNDTICIVLFSISVFNDILPYCTNSGILNDPFLNTCTVANHYILPVEIYTTA